MTNDLRDRVARARAAYDDHQDIASHQEPDATTEYIAALEAATADAQAALDRMIHDTKTEWWNKGYKAVKREARNEARKEAETAISKLRMQNQDIVSQWNGAIDQASDAILALMEDTDDE